MPILVYRIGRLPPCSAVAAYAVDAGQDSPDVRFTPLADTSTMSVDCHTMHGIVGHWELQVRHNVLALKEQFA
ncbi:MAG: hypothetical protein ABI947_30270 [Chloroflexota bacterium]